MIAQFVGDLLQTIGEASVDDLRELFAGRPESEKFAAPVDFPVPALPGPSSRPALPPRAPRGDGRQPRRFPSRSTMSSGSSSPPGVAEITDPESLLSLGRSSEAPGLNGAGASNRAHHSNGVPAEGAAPSFVDSPRAPSRARAQALLEVRERAAAPHVPAEAHPEPEGDSPASSVRPVGSGATVKLSDNETLARVSNSGVVIRRKKRAQG